MRSLSLQLFFCALFSFLSCKFIYSQQDPLHWTHPIKVEANDIYLQWLQNDNGTVHSYQKVYRLKIDSLFLPPDSLISATPRQQDSRTGGGSFTDAAAGRFNISTHDEVVSVWKSQTGINIMIPEFDTTAALWTNSIQDSITGNIENQRIYVRTLDIDGDSLDEFIVAYITNDDSIHFNLYDVDSTLHPTLLSSYCDKKLDQSATSFPYVRYLIETGDFNGDGTDELALFTASGLYDSVQVKVKIYDITGGTFIPKGQQVFSLPSQNSLKLVDFNMAASSGHFTNGSADELAFADIGAWGFGYGSSEFWILQISQDLNTIIKYIPYTVSSFLNGKNGFNIDLTAGDLNGDGLDEIVCLGDLYYDETLIVFEPYNINNNLYPFPRLIKQVRSGGPSDFTQSHDFLKIDKINQDTVNDIIIVKNIVDNNTSPNGFFVTVVSLNDTLNKIALLSGQLIGDESDVVDYKAYSIATGNFDGFNFTIGQPLHYTQNNVIQTLVELNAPPIHFDVFNGQSNDINGCFNGGNCDFYSQYNASNTSSVQVTTSVHKDWEVSAGVHESLSFLIAPAGVGASINFESYFLHKWGNHFSNDTTNIQEWTNKQQITTEEDDEIYATTIDYDLWEYPLYYGNEDFPRETIMTFIPHNPRGQWFPSKSYYALSYVPNHEVGNILSYPDSLIHISNISVPVGVDFGHDYYTLTSGTSYDWSLTSDDFTSVSSTTTRENTNSFGISFGFEVKGDFSHTKYSSQTTSVSSSININTHFGGVNLGIGVVRYTVRPYAYWKGDGTLELNYAVQPELAPPGKPETWWQTHYQQYSDPTFILPWLLDPEKGYTLDDPNMRYLTNDIFFQPSNPSPGDTLTITAHIRNFSLIATPLPVAVSFYLGDPDSGGVPITGVNGTNTVNTSEPVPSRLSEDVQLKWIVPNGLPQYPRIYAVLDQQNKIQEIHENNNKGFKVLGRQGIVSGVIASNTVIPNKYILYQSYPNPFNPTATIRYSIPKSSLVSIEVYDILGRKVSTLVNEYEKAGTYNIEFKGNKYASGVYFYKIQAGSFVQTKKMILLK